MQVTGNPALALRRAIEALMPPGFLRWDRSGRALLVSDAPRRPGGRDFVKLAEKSGARCFEADGLLWIDLPEAAYAALPDGQPAAAADGTDFETAALLRSILRRPPVGCKDLDIPLMRGALLAAAQGGEAIRRFLPTLREADAEALRTGRTVSVRAAAAAVACAAEPRNGP